MRVAGVDGCKRGWVCVVLDEGRWAEARIAPDFGALLAGLDGAAVIAVDIPIGLARDRFRDCDRHARAALAGRASSLFLVPPAAAYLDCASYEDAVARCRELTGAGFSRQAFALRAKVRDVDGHAADPRVREVHPELSFSRMNGGAPLPGKKSWTGQAARRRLLEREGICLPEALGPAGAAAPDDVLDAAAAAWTAQRIARGDAASLPAEPTQHDPRGRPILIWT